MAVPAVLAQPPADGSQFGNHALPGPADVLEGIVQAEKEAAAAQEARETPQAIADRETSQTAFGSLSSSVSEQLLRATFPEQLELLNSDPARSLSDANLDRVLGDGTAASVNTDGGTELVEAGIPVITEGGGIDDKVDLSLVRRGGTLEPENPLVPVTVPAIAGDLIALGNGALAIAPQVTGNESTAHLFGDKNAFFHEVRDDTDMLVSPIAGGVEISDQLRSASSPEYLRFDLSLPDGALLQADGNGGADVARDGQILARIPAPAAVDAEGAEVPVELQIDEDTLALKVLHRGGDFAYPILVDPSLVQDWSSCSWLNGCNLQALTPQVWHWDESGTSWIFHSYGCIWTCWGSGHGLFVSAEAGNHGAGQFGQWAYSVPGGSTYITNASLSPFMRNNYSCSKASFPQPHDYDGLWSASAGWAPLETNRANDFGNAAPSGFGQALIVGLSMGSNAAEDKCRRDIMLGGAAIWLTDPDVPTWNSAPSAADVWTDTAAVPVSTGTATDPGLGMKYFKLFTTDASGQPSGLIGTVERACTGLKESPCEATWSSQIANYNPAGLANGVSFLAVIAYDALGSEHSSQGQPVHVSIDHAAPEIEFAGELFGSEAKVHKGEVIAVDGSSAAFATAQSGMKSLEFFFDNQLVGRFPNTTTPPPCSNMQQGINLGSCKFQVPIELSGALTGSHSLKVVARDSVGHVSERTAALNFPKDETAPSLSFSGLLTPSLGAWAAAADSSVTMTAQDGGTGVVEEAISIDGNLVGQFTHECFAGGCSLSHAFSVPLTGYATGEHLVRAVAKDGAGNLAERKWPIRVDAAQPILTSVTAPEVPDSWTPQISSFKLNFSASDPDSGIKKVEVIRPAIQGGTLVSTPYVGSCDGKTIFTCVPTISRSVQLNTAEMREGEDTVIVKAYDLVGNVSAAKTIRVLIDREGPVVQANGPLISGPTGSEIGVSTKLNIRAKDGGSGIASVEMKLDNETNQVETLEEVVEKGGEQSCTNGQCVLEYMAEPIIGAASEPGPHLFSLTVTDAAGQSSTIEHGVLIDTRSPEVALSGPLVESVGTSLGDRPTKLAASATDGGGEFSSEIASLDVAVDGEVVETIFPSCDSPSCVLRAAGEYVYNPTEWSPGPHTVSVIATDGTGNLTVKNLRVNEPLSAIAPPCPGGKAEVIAGGRNLSPREAVESIQVAIPAALAAAAVPARLTDEAGVELNPHVSADGPSVSLDELGIDTEGTLAGGGIEDVAGGAFTVGQSACLRPLQVSSSADEPMMATAASVVFPNALPDTDTVVRPTAFGTAVIESLRNERGSDPPATFEWAVSLRPGEELVELTDGGIAVVDPEGEDVHPGVVPPVEGNVVESLDSVGQQIARSEHDLAQADQEVDGSVTLVVDAPEVVTNGGDVVPGILRIGGGDVIVAELPPEAVSKAEALVVNATPAAEVESICASVLSRSPEFASTVCGELKEDDSAEDGGDDGSLSELQETSDPALNGMLQAEIQRFEAITERTSGSGANVSDEQKRFCRPDRRKIECAEFILDGQEAADEEARLFNVTETDSTMANAFRHSYWVALMRLDETEEDAGLSWSIMHEEGEWEGSNPHPVRRKNSRMDVINDFVGRNQAGSNDKDSCNIMLTKSREAIFLGQVDPFKWVKRHKNYQFFRLVFRKRLVGESHFPVYPVKRKC